MTSQRSQKHQKVCFRVLRAPTRSSNGLYNGALEVIRGIDFDESALEGEGIMESELTPGYGAPHVWLGLDVWLHLDLLHADPQEVIHFLYTP